jgi:hypothetical protein
MRGVQILGFAGALVAAASLLVSCGGGGGGECSTIPLCLLDVPWPS